MLHTVHYIFLIIYNKFPSEQFSVSLLHHFIWSIFKLFQKYFSRYSLIPNIVGFINNGESDVYYIACTVEQTIDQRQVVLDTYVCFTEFVKYVNVVFDFIVIYDNFWFSR
jgi:hypothetical protein